MKSLFAGCYKSEKPCERPGMMGESGQERDTAAAPLFMESLHDSARGQSVPLGKEQPLTQHAYHYEMPSEATDRPKMAVDVMRTELLSVGIQIVNGGGETNLHAHNGEDAVWLVLGGHAAFYDEDGSRLVLGPHEMIVLPSGTKYWFESSGEEPLEIMRMGARDPRVTSSRTDVTSRDRVARVGATPHVQAEEIAPVPA